VAIIDFRPDKDDQLEPFSGEHGRLIYDFLNTHQIPLQFLWMAYLIRARKTPRPRFAASEMRFWLQNLIAELDLVEPRAVILHGHTAAAVLGESRPIEKLRKTRFVKRSQPNINWFVTYSCLDVASRGGLDSEVGQSWMLDHLAVFERTAQYFATEVIE